MKTRILPLACAFFPLLSLSSAADSSDCFVPMTNWQPRQAIIELATSNSWKIRRIKIDDGCYEIYGWDKDGNEIEVKLMPDTLDIVKFEFEKFHSSDDDDDDDDDDESDD